MKEKNQINIGLFDSGVGGLSVLKRVVNTVNYDNVFYLGDNMNAPYGNKTKQEILDLSIRGVIALINSGANIIVIACNTLSVSVLYELTLIFEKTPFFGVYPPVEKSIIDKDDYLLLCTVKTASSMLSLHKQINVLPLKELAQDIEMNLFKENKINLEKHFQGVRKDYKKIILGCTHYNLIEKEIKNYFPFAKVVSGDFFTVKKLNNYLLAKYSYKKRNCNKPVFLGAYADKNREIFSKIC